jgi:outer membrane protein TolC
MVHPSGHALGAGLVLWFAGLAPLSAQAGGVPPQSPGAPPAGSQRVLQLSLEDALGIALRNNFTLEIERLVTSSARYAALGSWGAFDPVVRVSGSASKSENEPVSSIAGSEENDLALSSSLTFPLVSGGSLDLSYAHVNSDTNSPVAVFDVSTSDVITVALTQPLLRGAWKRYATVEQRASEIALERQIEREREVRELLLLDVYNSYWDVVSAQEELKVRELAVDLGKQQLSQDQRRLEVGAGTEVDVLQSETNVAEQEQLRLVADYTLRQARDSLRRTLAPRPEGDYEEYLAAWDWPIETLTPLPSVADAVLDWRASLRAAVEQRPILAQSRLDIEAAEVDLQRASSERLPQLDLRLSSSSAGFDVDPSDSFSKAAGWDFPSSSAGLLFSLPIWNRTARNAEHSARASLRSAMLIFDRIEVDVLAEVRTAVNEVDKQGESVAAAAKSRSLAQRQLEAEETRQQVGLSTTFQVLQFQEDLAVALSAEVLAKASYAKALARLSFVEGQLGVGLEAAPPPPEGQIGK